MPQLNIMRAGWGQYETYSWTIENSEQLAWMRQRWSGYPQWRVGFSQDMGGTYLNNMRRELGAAFDAGYVHPPLARWWEPEIANLPLDIHPSM